MELKENVLYHVTLKDLAFGVVDKERLIEVVSSGRICGILIESDIAARFDLVKEGTQGESADLIDPKLGKIQAKTYHSTKHTGKFKRGDKKGNPKAEEKSIFTTKSGLFDSMKRRVSLGEDVSKQITDYFDKYDKFCYIDIAKMKELKYSFVIVSSDVPKKKHVQGNISYSDILENILEEVYLET